MRSVAGRRKRGKKSGACYKCGDKTWIKSGYNCVDCFIGWGDKHKIAWAKPTDTP